MRDVPFELDPRLDADTVAVADLPVSRLLLMNDQRFPWCILVPRIPGLRELHDLPPSRWTPLMAEIDAVSRALLAEPRVSKINVGALGNVVTQLHVHVIGRWPGDAAWPGPVWGTGPAEHYAPGVRESLCARLREALP